MPSGLNAIDHGSDPVSAFVAGFCATGVSAPVDPSTLNTETVSASSLAVARRPPAGLNATEYGAEPVSAVVGGFCVTGVSAPVAPSTLKIETVLPLPDGKTFDVASRLPDGLNATEFGF